MNKRMTILGVIALMLVGVMVFGFTGQAGAVEFDEDGLVGPEETIDDDLFIASDIVEIKGTVNGDVFATAGLVKIEGEVNGSVVALAQTILISGEINGSLYGGSSTITLESGASIARNLYYGGFNLNTEAGSTIDRDLLVGAYQALLSGSINRDVRAGVGALEVEGTIGGDVIAEVGSAEEDQMPVYFGGPPGVDTIVPTGLRVSEGADIGGELRYKSADNMNESIQITPGGGIEFRYDPPEVQETDLRNAGRVGLASVIGKWIVKRIQVFFTLLLLGGLVIWQVPELLRKTAQNAEENVLPSAGYGLVSMVIVYLGAFLTAGLIIAAAVFFGAVTLGGLSKTILSVGFSSLGLVLAIFGLLVSYLSKLVVCFLAGEFLLSKTLPDAAQGLAWPLVLGIFLYVLLRAIPVFGWMLGALITLIGLGAMWLVYRERQAPVLEEA